METQDRNLKDSADGKNIPAQLRGETLAFAMQYGALHLAANFFEPYINYRTQRYYSDQGMPHGNYTQNLAGEFAGDVIGCGTLILSEVLFPHQLHGFTKAARKLVDPLYSTAANWVFAKERCEPGYEEKVEKWKIFQERNLIRSLIMDGAGIAGNVATQKWLIKNPSPTHIVFKGKLLSTAVTTAITLGTRAIFPESTRKMDKWLGSHMATMMTDAEAPQSYAEKIEAERAETGAPAIS